jgi:hypothetical protein
MVKGDGRRDCIRCGFTHIATGCDEHHSTDQSNTDEGKNLSERKLNESGYLICFGPFLDNNPVSLMVLLN